MTAENIQKTGARKVGDKLLSLYSRAFLHCVREGRTDWMPDALYLRMTYLARLGHVLHLKNPRSFNEKLQWIKLHDRKPEYTRIVDKYEVKQWAADLIGPEYIIPTLGVWDHFDDIDFDSLPEKFVLKCTHDSGGVVIVQDKAHFDRAAAREKLEHSLKKNYYYLSREWPYKDVKPRILAEKYIVESEEYDLKDYKYMCFNGKVRCCSVCSDRYSGSGMKLTFYDNDWQVMPVRAVGAQIDTQVPRPETHEKMMELSEILAKDRYFARADFYEIGGRIYFGELTFFPGAGFKTFDPCQWDQTFGSWISLTGTDRE